MRSAVTRWSATATRRTLRPSIFRPRTRHYADQGLPTAPKTYFQDGAGPLPQPQYSARPSLFWRFVRGSAIALAGFGAGLITDLDILEVSDDDIESLSELQSTLETVNAMTTQYPVDCQAFIASLEDLDPLEGTIKDPTARLVGGSGVAIEPGTITQVCQLSANIPCEDAVSCCPVGQGWFLWGVFDGLRGGSTSRFLAGYIPSALRSQLELSDAEDNASDLVSRISRTLLEFEAYQWNLVKDTMASDRISLPHWTALRLATSGTSMLMSLYHKASRQLMVVNIGTSAAVVGSWNAATGRYDPVEVSTKTKTRAGLRLDQAKYAYGDIFDGEKKPIPGLDIARAYGSNGCDADVVAEKAKSVQSPESDTASAPLDNWLAIDELTKPFNGTIDLQPKPDFVIMASQGFWEKVSHEDAVQGVQDWLEKFEPMQTAKIYLDRNTETEPLPSGSEPETVLKSEFTFDEVSQRAKWDTSQKHWVTERPNCAEHLIHNALGGSRRELVRMLLRMPVPYCKAWYDDMTVKVIFFQDHDETTESIVLANQAASREALQPVAKKLGYRR